MKSKIFTYIVLTTGFIFSCNEEPEKHPASFKWILSGFSKYGSSFFSFTIGDDNNLYCTGFVDSQFGVHRALINNNWETVVKLDHAAFNVQNFTVFKQNIYLISWLNNKQTLWRANETSVEEINFGNSIWHVSNLNSKLIITGDFTDGSNSYGIAYSTDGATFTSVAPAEGSFVAPGSFNMKANNKIFLYSYDGYSYTYDGSELRKIENQPYQGFNAVDSEGNFYAISSNYANGKYQSRIEKRANGVTSGVGGTFDEGISIHYIFFKDNTIIAVGHNSETSLSVAYFLDDNEWKEIPTTNLFFGAFKYNEKILAFTGNGIITELVYDQN